MVIVIDIGLVDSIDFQVLQSNKCVSNNLLYRNKLTLWLGSTVCGLERTHKVWGYLDGPVSSVSLFRSAISPCPTLPKSVYLLFSRLAVPLILYSNIF